MKLPSREDLIERYTKMPSSEIIVLVRGGELTEKAYSVAIDELGKRNISIGDISDIPSDHYEQKKSTDDGVPLNIRIISYLFILAGFSALLDMVRFYSNNSGIYINLCVFCLLIGPGLLKKNLIARKTALVFLIIPLFIFPLALIAAIVILFLPISTIQLDVDMMKFKIDLIGGAILFLLIFASYKAMKSRDANHFFGIKEH